MGLDCIDLVHQPLFHLLYPSRMMDDDEYGAIGGMSDKGNRSARRKPAPVPLCPPQIPHDLTRAQMWVALCHKTCDKGHGRRIFPPNPISCSWHFLKSPRCCLSLLWPASNSVKNLHCFLYVTLWPVSVSQRLNLSYACSPSCLANFIFVGCILLRYLRILYEHIIYMIYM
jgi:hypothetical protein